MIKKSLIISLLISALQFNCYGQIKPTSVLTPQEKVYGLSKLWQEVNYNFAYKYKMDSRSWDSLYIALIPQVQATSDDYQYFRLLEKFIAPLNDSHSTVGHKPQDISAANMVYLPIMNNRFGDYSIWLENIENKAIVSTINSEKSLEIPIGSQVIEVNGLATEDYIKTHIEPFVCESSAHSRANISTYRLLEGLEGSSFDVVFRKPNDSLFRVKLTLKPSQHSDYVSLPSSWKDDVLNFDWIDQDIAYVALNTFSEEDIVPQFIQKLPELRKAKAMIIDIRSNNGGNGDYALEIAKYITDGDTILGARSKVRCNDSYKRAYQSNNDYVEQPSKVITNMVRKNDRLMVPIAVLTSNETVSAAEDFLIFLDRQKHIKRIGQATNGSTGQPMAVDLVKGLWVMICSVANYYPDGKEFVGSGIKPHIEVVEELNDKLSDTDKTLNTAIKHLTELISK